MTRGRQPNADGSFDPELSYQAAQEIQDEYLKEVFNEVYDLYQEYKDLYEKAPLAYVVLDHRGTVVRANEAAIAMLVVNRNQLLKAPMIRWVHPDWDGYYLKALDKVIKGGQKQEIDFPLNHDAGEPPWVHLVMTPYNMDDKPVKYIKCVLGDITAQKWYEKELVRARDNAEERERLKTCFLANMSHEIRTPMNGILGFASLLNSREYPEDEKKQFIEAIYESSNHLLNILNDIIEISKLDAGHHKITRTQVNVNEHLNYLKTFFEPEARQKGLHLTVTHGLPAEKAGINADKGKLNSILINLIKNAIKYTQTGSIEFGCELKKRQLLFFVKDTGIGIPQEKRDMIFDRFVQVFNIDSLSNKGIGLGLAITKAYVEMLGGEIWVRSQVNQGSCFYFSLPYDPAINSHDHSSQPEIEKAYHWDDKTFLVVEDDPGSLQFLKELLNLTRANVITSVNGEKAIHKFKQLNLSRLDMILMDIRLPDRSGLEVISEIKDIMRDVPIIAQTAYAIEEDREKCLMVGADDYITKPINTELLLEKIDRIINGKKEPG